MQTNQSHTQIPHQPMRCLKVGDVAQKLGIGVSTVWQKLKDDPTFPRSFPLFGSGKATRWRETDIDNFIISRLQSAALSR
ncbi:helix-turn-helix transcriptional regulator [Rugamonas apoptosis]|uniref:AlpA family phage regulatory protein n=1 Tax=Rugamonas apoptosis TaxID=2758570 RepID=A0A7W2FCY8_9BURK|nr:AlpA family phage regulatory protein [Rugamonas apoptosis]MBA5689393.1 AlpA family phage regulatory protein [Rugamonas apoptosis]